MRARRFAPAAGLIALALAGCGGGNTLSATDLRAAAGAICSTASRQTSQISLPGSPAGAAVFLTKGIAVITPERAQLRALVPPDSLANTYSSALSAFSHKLAALTATHHLIATGGDPVQAMTTLQQTLTPIEMRENEAWQTLGIPACVNH
jgi:hypothetical protein